MFICNFPEFVTHKTGGKVLDWFVNLLVTVSTFLCVQVAWCDGKSHRREILVVQALYTCELADLGFVHSAH